MDSDVESIDDNAMGISEREALKVRPPDASQNFLAPVNDVNSPFPGTIGYDVQESFR